MKFFTGDWVKDPSLTLCDPATRGVWIDLICAMHDSDRSGKLCGTMDQLARFARCSTVVLAQALTDLQTNKAADVTHRNGQVTVVNRRMERDYKARVGAALRQQRFRSNRKVTTPCHIPESESEETTTTKSKFRPPTSDEVAAYCRERKSPVDPEAFMAYYTANGWRVGRNPMKNWKACITTWERNEKNRGVNGHAKPQPVKPRLPTPEEDARWSPTTGIE